MGGDAVLPGRPVRTWAARGRLPGPPNQPIVIVAAAELTSCKVPGMRESVPGSAAGTTTVGAGWGRDGRWPGRGASGRWQAADFEQLEPERLDLREHAVQRGAVGQRPGQHGVAAAGPGLQSGERGAYRLAQAAADTDAGSSCDLPEPGGRFSAVNGSRARSPTVTYRA